MDYFLKSLSALFATLSVFVLVISWSFYQEVKKDVELGPLSNMHIFLFR